MTQIKLLPQKINLLLAITLALVSYTPVQAQPVNPLLVGQQPAFYANELFKKPLIFTLPPPPFTIGSPSHRRDGAGNIIIGDHRNRTAGASRSDCPRGDFAQTSKKPLTALGPVYYSGSRSEVVWGVTTTEHPTLWFYVPYLRPATGKFVLDDGEGNSVYEADVTLPETPGVVSISLPSTAPPLEIGKLYNWYFGVYCPSQDISDYANFYVYGSITRNSLNPALTSQLEQATPQQRIALYAANGIWHEALTTATELRRTNPNAPEWAALLEAVGLDAIATEPIVECCQLEEP